MQKSLYAPIVFSLVLNLTAFAGDAHDAVEFSSSDMVIPATGPAYLPGSISNRAGDVLRAKCVDDACMRFVIVNVSGAADDRIETVLSRTFWASEFTTSIDELRRKNVIVPYETVGSLARLAREDSEIWAEPVILVFITLPGMALTAGFDTVTLPIAAVDSMLKGRPYRLLKKIRQNNIKVSNRQFKKIAAIFTN
jgi:hypothetical protein